MMSVWYVQVWVVAFWHLWDHAASESEGGRRVAFGFCKSSDLYINSQRLLCSQFLYTCASCSSVFVLSYR